VPYQSTPPAPRSVADSRESLITNASPRDSRLAIAGGGLLLAAFAATAPWARVQWPAVPALVAVCDTVVIVLQSIAVWLVYVLYRRTGSVALLALLSGYIFTLVLVAAHALSFPDALVPGSVLGNAQTAVWLRMGWHGVFPVFVAAYALLRSRDTSGPGATRRRDWRAVMALLIAIGLALAVVALATRGAASLPPLMSGSRYLAAAHWGLWAGWMAHLVALGLLVWAPRGRRVLDLWLALGVAATLVDLALSAILTSGHLQAGFYIGRVYGLLGIAFVPFALLRESVAAHAAGATAMARMRDSEDQVLADLRDTRLLHELGARLVAEGDDTTFHEEIARAAMALTGADGGSVQILDPGSHTPRLIATVGADSGMAARYPSAHSTPLVSRTGREVGRVSIHWAEPRHVGDRERRYLDLLARQAADLIEHRQSEEVLRQAQAELEKRIADRTAALTAEVAERRAAENRSKALLGRLMSVQEEERRRIARDIHDHVGQQITALRMNLESIRATGSPDARLVAAAERAARVAEELDRSIDALARELRPAALDHLGLTAAVENLVRGWSERFGVPVEFRNAVNEGLRVSADAEANLYRITQEALHNIYKHAKASVVRVTLSHADGHLQLVIQDDGRGFSPVDMHQTSIGGLGLESMRERASLIGGQLVVRSAWGHGTTVMVRVPAAAGTM
jgi:signal transduction histidine kinase